MTKLAYLQSNMTGGELSPRMDGRVDVTKFKNGLKKCENFQVLPHGGVRKRPGSRFVIEQRSPTEDVVFVPFQYNTEQAYVILMGPGYCWFMKDQGIITFTGKTITGVTLASPAMVTCPAHGFVNGDRVLITGMIGTVELNNRVFQIENVTTNTFDLQGIDSTGYTAFESGGVASKIVELTTDYTAAELPELTFAQSADVLYVCSRTKPIRKITRQSNTSWSLVEPSIVSGPFRTINGDRSLRLTPSAFSAAATGYGTHIVGETFTLTATGGFPFAPGMTGAIFRLNEEGGVTGIENAPVGDSTRSIAANQVYTKSAKVYGIFQVSVATNWSSFTRVPEHDAGTVRVRGSSNSFFDADFLHPGYCVVKIIGYTSPTVVTCQIVRYQMPASIVTGGTTFWEEGAWSAYRGYPRAVAFYEQRLFVAGSDSDPQVLWSSRSNAYEDFEDGTQDDNALVYRINSGSADVIRWLSSGRVLTAGSSMGEFAIAASNQNEALTPSNFKANPQTTYGVSLCPPVRVNQAVLYPQRSGKPSNPAKKLREFAYSYESDSFNSTDITIFSEHIFGPGISRLAYQLEPDSIIWARRTDGVLAACTYERAQEVVAWHRHVLGGNGAQVQMLCVIPGDDGDEVWLSVKRTIAGQTVRYVEVMTAAFPDTGVKENAVIVDASLSYVGSSTRTISGLWHLRGETVKVLNNGSVETVTVSNTGRITLATPTTKAHIGYGYKAILETEDFEGGNPNGTGQARMKRINKAWVRLLNSLGGTYGSDATDQEELLFRTIEMPMGSSPPLFSGLVEIEHPAGHDRKVSIRIEHDDPLPFHVTGIVCEMNVVGV